jgi:hypothetical protein
MKILPLATFSIALLAASLPLVTPVQAGTGIQRCAAADGTTVYTDTPCSLLGAAARPLPSELLNRIAREEARTVPADAEDADAAAPAPVVVARRSPTSGCARTPTQLAMDLRGSLALRDVNRLAESYHWVGLSQKQSHPIMQRLERLTQQPLEDTQYFDAQIGPGGMQLADAVSDNAPAGVMQMRFGGDTRQVLDFEVARYAGCYFIKF